MASYIEKGCGDWELSLSIPEEYKLLDCVFSENDKEIALEKYLTDWYSSHSGYAWYDSHLRDTDTYCGYWSFESAAIAKIMDLCNYEIGKSEYFPVI